MALAVPESSRAHRPADGPALQSARRPAIQRPTRRAVSGLIGRRCRQLRCGLLGQHRGRLRGRLCNPLRGRLRGRLHGGSAQAMPPRRPKSGSAVGIRAVTPKRDATPSPGVRRERSDESDSCEDWPRDGPRQFTLRPAQPRQALGSASLPMVSRSLTCSLVLSCALEVVDLSQFCS